jgi:hypothetical protein
MCLENFESNFNASPIARSEVWRPGLAVTQSIDYWRLAIIIMEARMVPTAFVENLIKENRELACILGASIRTAQAKVSRISKSPITNAYR